MGKFNRFEDILAWKRARRFAAEVYDVTGTRPFVRDLALRISSDELSFQ